MLKTKKAFTVVELIIAIVIVVMVMGIVLIMMTRGASNVQKGSFNALAANQAFWIISSCMSLRLSAVMTVSPSTYVRLTNPM